VRFFCGEVAGAAFARTFVPSSHEYSFLEVEIAVADNCRTFPIFKNPFFLPYSILGERRIDGLWSTPGLQYLFFGHSNQDTVLFDVLLKVRIAQLNDQWPDHEHEDKQRKPNIDDDSDRAAANERRFLSVGIKGEGLRFSSHGEKKMNANSVVPRESRNGQ
jgi:hypothetical protein